MRSVPKTRYTTVGRDHIAYQVFGEGPPDFVFAPNWNSNVEAMWDLPPLARFIRQLARLGRVIVFDKRGTGLSDAISTEGQPILEQFADDLPTVLDAVGVERVALVSGDVSSLVSIVFAASYPERVSSLILVNSWAGLSHSGDDADGLPSEELDEHTQDVWHIWLDGDMSRIAPSLVDDVTGAEEVTRYFRLAASPNAAYATRNNVLGLDVRHVLPSVQAPTLIIHRTDDEYFGVDHSRYLASHIPGARLVELPGEEHLIYMGDADTILGEIEVFVTGERSRTVTDRVLTTVLFTDIVQSTSRLVEVGDQRWRETLDRYDAELARNIDLFRGRQVKFTGDGTLAVFDGSSRAIRCALAFQEALQRDGLELRSGLHTGEVELRGDDVAGIAVHIAQRVQALAEPNEVLVSRTVGDLVSGSGIEFEERGEHELKGVPGAWRLFAATD